MTVSFTASSFLNAINVEGVVLVMVSSRLCPPCVAFASVFETAAAANPEVLFGMVNADTESDLVQALSITSVPTLLVFRGGILLLSRAGSLPLPTLQGLLDKVAGLDMSKVGRNSA